MEAVAVKQVTAISGCSSHLRAVRWSRYFAHITGGGGGGLFGVLDKFD